MRKWRSAQKRYWAALSPRLCRVSSSTTKSFPAPCILVKRICIARLSPLERVAAPGGGPAAGGASLSRHPLELVQRIERLARAERIGVDSGQRRFHRACAL